MLRRHPLDEVVSLASGQKECRWEPILIPRDDDVGWQGPASFSGDPDARLGLLASVLASDPRPSIVMSAAGDVLLANAAAGARLVAECSTLGSSPAWDALHQEARQLGCSRAAVEGHEGDLCHLPADVPGQSDYFLFRRDQPGLAEELNRKAEEFARITHDLRAPLQALIVAGESLASGTQAEGSAAEAPAAIARVALDQISNLLELSRMDRVSADAEPIEVFDMTLLVRSMGIMMAPLCAQNGNHLEVLLPTAEAWQRGPAHLVRAIIQNLVGNAARFTRNGRIDVALRLDLESKDAERQIVLEIADTGPGLSDEDRIRLQQTHALPSAGGGSEGGFGLGFSIVMRAIARLSGQMDIQTQPGQGTRFLISFPMATSAAADFQQAPSSTTIRLDGLRVLVVEDNPVNLAILLRTISDAGAEAEGVVNGLDALTRLSTPNPVDLVLLDVTMPGIDGIEVTRRLRAREADGAHLLIVGLTAHVDPVVRGTCLAVGMDRVLAKPVGPSELRRALRAIWDGVVTNSRVWRKDEARGEMLNEALVNELMEEMGPKAALAFMRQALAEARQVQDALRDQGMTIELRRQIHSALGSSGLTGLAGVEHGLRLLQSEARAKTPLGTATTVFVDVLDRTEAVLAGMGAG